MHFLTMQSAVELLPPLKIMLIFSCSHAVHSVQGDFRTLSFTAAFLFFCARRRGSISTESEEQRSLP